VHVYVFVLLSLIEKASVTLNFLFLSPCRWVFKRRGYHLSKKNIYSNREGKIYVSYLQRIAILYFGACLWNLPNSKSLNCELCRNVTKISCPQHSEKIYYSTMTVLRFKLNTMLFSHPRTVREIFIMKVVLDDLNLKPPSFAIDNMQQKIR
jgi:hypothetical protein